MDIDRTTSRELLDQLARALMNFHKALLDSAREEYSAKHGQAKNSYEVLALVMNDPFFAWLRPLSAMIIRIDDLAESEFSEDELAAVRKDAEQIFENKNFDTDAQNETGSQYQQIRAMLRALPAGSVM